MSSSALSATGRAQGSRKLVEALEAPPFESRVLEVVGIPPGADGLDIRSLLDRDGRVPRRLSAAVRDVAVAHDAAWYRLGSLVYAVLAPEGYRPGRAAIAGRAAVAACSESLADCLVRGSVHVPEEEVGAQALAVALARLRARTSWSSRSTERQLRDVLLRILHERRGNASPRVAELAVRVGRKMGLTVGELDVLARAAELQDIGKVLIPDSILSKSEPLSGEEWDTVRRHPLVAGQILGAAPALAPVAELVRASQERYDGTGYPDGLAEDAIPLGSRIIAVCIAYDAMTADRPYRPALPERAAIRELRVCAGHQFDPKVVSVFCAVIREEGVPEPQLAA